MITFQKLGQLGSAASSPRKLRRFGMLQFALWVLLSFAGTTAHAQTVDCVIATNDGQNGFRTDVISNCRINVSNGNATYVVKQKRRERSYVSVEPMTTRHLAVAKYWLQRVEQLRLPAATNPARFDSEGFLRAASQAKHGYVLTRKKRNGGHALNFVFITDGVYRSIDFSGTDLREVPSGLLTTQR